MFHRLLINRCTLTSPSQPPSLGGVLQGWRRRLVDVPCPRTPRLDPQGSVLRFTLLEQLRGSRQVHSHVVGKNRVTKMHIIQEITLNQPKHFPQHHFLFGQISFLMSNYFPPSTYYPCPASWNVDTESKNLVPSHCLHLITLSSLSLS